MNENSAPLQLLTDTCLACPSSFAKLAYLPEGRALMTTLWEETLREFDFAGARDILQSLKKRHRSTGN